MRVLPRSPGNLLLALVLACLVWYVNALDRRERVSERRLDAPVSLVNVPADMVVTSDVPRAMTLRLRGPLSILRTLDPNTTGVVLDLSNFSEGLHEITVDTAAVVAPAGTEVLAVSPAQLAVRVERVVDRRVPVRPRVVGVPAAGCTLRGVIAQPSTALISGPRSHLNALPFLPLDPVTVDGAEGPVEAMVALRPPSPLMRIVEPLEVRVVAVIAHDTGGSNN